MSEEIRRAKEALSRIYRAPYLVQPEPPQVRAVVDALSLGRNDVVVELGAGDGLFTLPIARELEKMSGEGIVFACDFSATLLDALNEAAVQERLDIRVRGVGLGDVLPYTLPFAREAVDSVLAVNVLQYLRNPIPYLEEIARVLKPGGALLIGDWQQPGRAVASPSPEEGQPMDAVATLLDAAGLTSRAMIRIDGFVYAMRVIKPQLATI